MGDVILQEKQSLATEQSATGTAQVAADHLAKDVLVLDVSEVSSYADYLLIATGQTERHLGFLADHITRDLREQGIHIDHREGEDGSGWVLLDFGDIIVHLFTEEQRAHYNLESEDLWGKGREVLRLD